MAEITLKGRRIPLLYTVLEMKEIQAQIAPLEQLQYIAFGRNPDDEKDTSKFGGAEHLDALAKMIVIFGNAGLEEAGEEPNLTYKSVMRAMRPQQLAEAVTSCMAAIQEGMASEIPPKHQDGPVDVTLMELEKKKESGSPT